MTARTPTKANPRTSKAALNAAESLTFVPTRQLCAGCGYPMDPPTERPQYFDNPFVFYGLGNKESVTVVRTECVWGYVETDGKICCDSKTCHEYHLRGEVMPPMEYVPEEQQKMALNWPRPPERDTTINGRTAKC